jgi:transcriptional regulator with XRE-family HTH domain
MLHFFVVFVNLKPLFLEPLLFSYNYAMKLKTRRPAWAGRLVAARIRTGLTATALARKLGFSQQRYNNYEHGKSEPNIAGWNRLKAEIGGAEVYFILTGEWLEPREAGTQQELRIVQEPPRIPIARPFLRLVAGASFNPERDLIHEGWK